MNLSSLCRREKSHILISEIKNLSSKNWAVNYKASSDTNSSLTPGTLCSALLTPRMLSFTPGKIFQTCFALPIPKPAYAAQWESSLVFSGSLVLMHQVADFLISGYCACWECFTSQPRSHIGIKWASGAFIPASLSQMISLETNTEK